MKTCKTMWLCCIGSIWDIIAEEVGALLEELEGSFSTSLFPEELGATGGH